MKTNYGAIFGKVLSTHHQDHLDYFDYHEYLKLITIDYGAMPSTLIRSINALTIHLQDRILGYYSDNQIDGVEEATLLTFFYDLHEALNKSYKSICIHNNSDKYIKSLDLLNNRAISDVNDFLVEILSLRSDPKIESIRNFISKNPESYKNPEESTELYSLMREYRNTLTIPPPKSNNWLYAAALIIGLAGFIYSGYRISMNNRPPDAEQLFQRAKRLNQEGHSEQAIATLDSIRKFYPDQSKQMNVDFIIEKIKSKSVLDK